MEFTKLSASILALQCLRAERVFASEKDFRNIINTSKIDIHDLLVNAAILKKSNHLAKSTHLVTHCLLASGNAVETFQLCRRLKLLRTCAEAIDPVILWHNKTNGGMEPFTDEISAWFLEQSAMDLALDPDLEHVTYIVRLPKTLDLPSKQWLDSMTTKWSSMTINDFERHLQTLDWVQTNVAAVWFLKSQTKPLFEADQKDIVNTERVNILKGSAFKDAYSQARGLTHKILNTGDYAALFSLANDLRTLSFPAYLTGKGQLFDDTYDLLSHNDWIEDHLSALNYLLTNKTHGHVGIETKNTVVLYVARNSKDTQCLVEWFKNHGFCSLNPSLLDIDQVAYAIVERMPLNVLIGLVKDHPQLEHYICVHPEKTQNPLVSKIYNKALVRTMPFNAASNRIRVICDLACCSETTHETLGTRIKDVTLDFATHLIKQKGNEFSDVVILSKNGLNIIEAKALPNTDFSRLFSKGCPYGAEVGVIDAIKNSINDINDFVLLVGSTFSMDGGLIQSAIDEYRKAFGHPVTLMVVYMVPKAKDTVKNKLSPDLHAMSLDGHHVAHAYSLTSNFLTSTQMMNSFKQPELISLLVQPSSSNLDCERMAEREEEKQDDKDYRAYKAKMQKRSISRAPKREKASYQQSYDQKVQNHYYLEPASDEEEETPTKVLIQDLFNDDDDESSSSYETRLELTEERTRVRLEEIEAELTAISLNPAKDSVIYKRTTKDIGRADTEINRLSADVAEIEQKVKQLPDGKEKDRLLQNKAQEESRLRILREQRIGLVRLKSTWGLSPSDKAFLEQVENDITRKNKQLEDLNDELSRLNVQGVRVTQPEEFVFAPQRGKTDPSQDLRFKISRLESEIEELMRDRDELVQGDSDTQYENKRRRIENLQKERERLRRDTAKAKEDLEKLQFDAIIKERKKAKEKPSIKLKQKKPLSTNNKTEVQKIKQKIAEIKEEKKEVEDRYQNIVKTKVADLTEEKRRALTEKYKQEKAQLDKREAEQQQKKKDSSVPVLTQKETQIRRSEDSKKEQIEHKNKVSQSGSNKKAKTKQLRQQVPSPVVTISKPKVPAILEEPQEEEIQGDEEESLAETQTYVSKKLRPLKDKETERLHWGFDLQLEKSTSYYEKKGIPFGDEIRLKTGDPRTIQIKSEDQVSKPDARFVPPKLLSKEEYERMAKEKNPRDERRFLIDRTLVMLEELPYQSWFYVGNPLTKALDALFKSLGRVNQKTKLTDLQKASPEKYQYALKLTVLKEISLRLSELGKVLNSMFRSCIGIYEDPDALSIQRLDSFAKAINSISRDPFEPQSPFSNALGRFKYLEDGNFKTKIEVLLKKITEFKRNIIGNLLSIEVLDMLSIIAILHELILFKKPFKKENIPELVNGLATVSRHITERETYFVKYRVGKIFYEELRKIEEVYLYLIPANVSLFGTESLDNSTFYAFYLLESTLQYLYKVNTGRIDALVLEKAIRDIRQRSKQEIDKILEQKKHDVGFAQDYFNSIDDFIKDVQIYAQKNDIKPPEFTYSPKLDKLKADYEKLRTREAKIKLLQLKVQEWLKDNKSASVFISGKIREFLTPSISRSNDNRIISFIEIESWFPSIAKDVFSKYGVQVNDSGASGSVVLSNIPFDEYLAKLRKSEIERDMEIRSYSLNIVQRRTDELKKLLQDKNLTELDRTNILDLIKVNQNILDSSKSENLGKDPLNDAKYKRTLIHSAKTFFELLSKPLKPLLATLFDEACETILDTAFDRWEDGLPTLFMNEADEWPLELETMDSLRSIYDVPHQIVGYAGAEYFILACADVDILYKVIDPRNNLVQNLTRLETLINIGSENKRVQDPTQFMLRNVKRIQAALKANKEPTVLINVYKHIISAIDEAVENNWNHIETFFKTAYTLLGPMVALVSDKYAEGLIDSAKMLQILPTPAKMLEMAILGFLDEEKYALYMDESLALRKLDTQKNPILDQDLDKIYEKLRRLMELIRDPVIPAKPENNNTTSVNPVVVAEDLKKDILALGDKSKAKGEFQALSQLEFLKYAIIDALDEFKNYYSDNLFHTLNVLDSDNMCKLADTNDFTTDFNGALERIPKAATEIANRWQHLNQQQKEIRTTAMKTSIVETAFNNKILTEWLDRESVRKKKWFTSSFELFPNLGLLFSNLNDVKKSCKYYEWLINHWTIWEYCFNLMFMQNIRIYLVDHFYSGFNESQRVFYRPLLDYYLGSDEAFIDGQLRPPYLWNYVKSRDDINEVLVELSFDSYELLKAYPYQNAQDVAKMFRDMAREYDWPYPFQNLDSFIPYSLDDYTEKYDNNRKIATASYVYDPDVLYLVNDVVLSCKFLFYASEFLKNNVIHIRPAKNPKISYILDVSFYTDRATSKIKDLYTKIRFIYDKLSLRASTYYHEYMKDLATGLRLYLIIKGAVAIFVRPKLREMDQTVKLMSEYLNNFGKVFSTMTKVGQQILGPMTDFYLFFVMRTIEYYKVTIQSIVKVAPDGKKGYIQKLVNMQSEFENKGEEIKLLLNKRKNALNLTQNSINEQRQIVTHYQASVDTAKKNLDDATNTLQKRNTLSNAQKRTLENEVISAANLLASAKEKLKTMEDLLSWDSSTLGSNYLLNQASVLEGQQKTIEDKSLDDRLKRLNANQNIYPDDIAAMVGEKIKDLTLEKEYLKEEARVIKLLDEQYQKGTETPIEKLEKEQAKLEQLRPSKFIK